MATNNILPFCPTDSGTNLLTQSAYAAAADRVSGNQPGVASSKLVNKAIRQSAFIASQLAQYISDKTGSDVLDDGNTATLLAIMNAAFAAPTTSYQIANVSVAGSVAASALTLNLKDSAGDAPSATSICSIGFRSATATSGVYNQRTVTGALSLVVPSGASLGMTSAVASYFYVYAIDTGSGVVLGVSSAVLDEGSVQSAVAISAGSTSATVLYATATQTNKPVRMIARILTTQATAGTWASALTEISPTPFVKNAFAAIRSVTTTDSCTNADQTLVLSGASFTETIFDALTNKGKILTIVHDGTSLSQVYTLATTGGQTIGGIASGSYALYTKGESLTIQSLGTSDWKILDHRASTDWADFPSLAYGTLWTATGTAGTYGTLATHKAQWRRVGSSMQIRWDYRSTVAGTAGTGILLFNLMSGPTIDTTVVTVNNATTYAVASYDSNVGSFQGQVNGTTKAYGDAVVYSTTQLKFALNEVSNASTTAGGMFGGTGVTDFGTAAALYYHFDAVVPITGWRS